MKALSTLALLLIVSVSYSQITLTNQIFPVKGDTLKYVNYVDTDLTLNVGSTGGPQTWDFSQLNKGVKNIQLCLDTSFGEDKNSFPEANLLIKTQIGQDLYLKVSQNKVEGLGLAGNNGFIPASFPITYSERPVLLQTPYTVFGTNNHSTKFSIQISTNIIPDTLLSGLPVTPDSIRIEFVNNSRALVNAYGTLTIQNQNFEVIREEVEEISKTSLAVRVFGIWLDPLVLLGGNLPPGFEDFAAADTTKTYNFYTNTKKETLVSLTYGTDNELQDVTFADLGQVISGNSDIYIDNNTVLYPNPVSQSVYFTPTEWEAGQYIGLVYNIEGKMVKAQIMSIQPTTTVEVMTDELSEGLYILKVVNSKGQIKLQHKFIKE